MAIDFNALRAICRHDLSKQAFSELEIALADAARYRWLKAEDRKVIPLGTISWRMQGNSMPCKLSDGDNLDALIDAAIANPGATVRDIYLIASARETGGDAK